MFIGLVGFMPPPCGLVQIDTGESERGAFGALRAHATIRLRQWQHERPRANTRPHQIHDPSAIYRRRLVGPFASAESTSSIAFSILA
jgi:hypothetical protein